LSLFFEVISGQLNDGSAVIVCVGVCIHADAGMVSVVLQFPFDSNGGAE
jgi:hypothetical protein